MISLKFFEASLNIRKAPNEKYKSNWEAFVDRQYENAYNWFDIEEEIGLGIQKYTPMKVRVTYVLNPATGLKLSDDWKSLIFNVGYDAQMGRRYKYFDNIWLTVNTEEYGHPTNNCIIRRCNNYLTFQDESGGLHKEPCVIDSSLKYGNIYYNNSVDIPQGSVKIWLQLNEYTKDIKINNRFILGYSEVYRVKTVLNYLSDHTFDEEGSPLIELDMQLDTIQVGDDFKNNTTGSSPIVPIGENKTVTLIKPNQYIIPQGENLIYSCNAYKDEIVIDDKFEFMMLPNSIPEDRYSFNIINENQFSILNYRKYTKENIQIQCTNTANSEVSVFNFTLGGVI